MLPLLRLRALPWLALLDAGRTTRAHLAEHLSEADRRRVAAIARDTRGDVRRLTERDKAELKRIAHDLNLQVLARDLAFAGGRLRRGRRRW